MDKYRQEYLKKMLATSSKIKRGVIRWTTNNRITPNDVAEYAFELGYKVNLETHRKALKRETKRLLDEYRSQPHPIDPEEMYEMRAAFGPGTTVVNILTGERIKL